MLNKMCPFLNCTMNGVHSYIIYCKGRKTDKPVKFKTEELRESHFNKHCTNECTSCTHYKILKAKEIR